MTFPPSEPIPEQPTTRRLTLKEAAARTGRSVTTLRRYIRATKLKAEKTPGRFGPEYTIDEQSLVEAGFQVLPPLPLDEVEGRPGGYLRARGRELSVRGSRGLGALLRGAGETDDDAPSESALGRPIEKLLLDFVPADLYRELAMKHEQLLVQYGMIRASGQRLFEYREEAERSSEDLRRAQERQKESQDRASREIGSLTQHLRQAELQLEEKSLQISSLREKVRVLELLTRNAITTESIEKQFLKVFEKERQIDALGLDLEDAPAVPPPQAQAVDPAQAPSPFPDASEEEAREKRLRLQALDRWLDSRLDRPFETEKRDH